MDNPNENEVMHVMVPVKRVVDHNVRVRIKADGSAVDTAGLKMSLNPFDEVALEQAVRLREAGLASKVTAVACGAAQSQDVLRTALAMGADAAVLIDPGSMASDGVAWVQALGTLARDEGVDLLLCGQQTIDDDLGALAPMLAAALDWPQAICVNRLALDAGELQVELDGDAGVERWRLSLPAVLGVDLRLCDPRAISLPNMMKARKAGIRPLALADFSVAGDAGHTLLACAAPPRRAPGLKLADLPALLAHLRDLPALSTTA